MEKAIQQDEDIASKSEYIYTAPRRIQVADTDEGCAQAGACGGPGGPGQGYECGLIPQGLRV